MEFLSQFLPILLYLAGIVLLVVLIILVIKLIKVVDKVDGVVDNVEGKINSFNGALAVMNKAADGLASISDSVIFGITTAISRIFNKGKKNNNEEDL